MATAAFIGVDVETTGLGKDCYMIELGLIAFDNRLNELSSYSTLVTPAPVRELQAASIDIVKKMHTDNGLWDDLSSSRTITYADAEQEALDWLAEVSGGVQLPILGSSITLDRNTLERTMPTLFSSLHYRSVDATGFFLIATETYGATFEDTAPAHRVLDDIRASAALITTAAEKIAAQIRR